MRKAISVVTNLLLFFAAVFASHADSTWEFSVQMGAAVQASPAQITLTWPQDSYMVPNSYTIYRKAPGATAWGSGTTLPGTATSYTDTAVTVGTAYEYQVVKTTAQYTGYGYLYTGINVPLTDNRGKLLLVVDKTHAAALASELSRLQQDLAGDGWSVVRVEVGREDSAASVKSRIKAQYDADPANVKAVFLFGHVPVPYSGDIVPDGHVPEHQGAWPCDGFYGDMDGAWTDASVNRSTSEFPRNYNVPGDGKFDQSTFPAPIKLMVGRVDLANLPGAQWTGGPATFPSELELLRNYLNKDHKFRHKQFDLPRRAYLADFFGVRDGEAFAASGWRNFAPLVGASNLVNLPEQGTWVPTLKDHPALCAYGTGAGSLTSVAGLGNSDAYHNVLTTELYANDIKAAFVLLFGSWLGDWDATDNILRSVLALPSYGLASAWSGRPHFFMHHMGLGEPIGYSARLTQNNGPSGLYHNQVNSAAGQIHVALMGDPTLRIHTVSPPTALSASGSTLKWTASTDTVVGYHVYQASSPSGPFTRLTESPVTTTTFTVPSPAAGSTFMVRAVKLETSPSGTYYNASQGAFLLGDTNSGGTPPANGSTPPDNGTTPDTGTTTNTTPTTPTAPAVSNTVVWVDDALPAGAVAGTDAGDAWTWVSGEPAPYHGTQACQSTLAPGLHQHYFVSATESLKVDADDVLFAHVYLDPSNPPSELMLQWNDGTWEHRAFWGTDLIGYGTNGTQGHVAMGALPAAGQWVRLEVPASKVGLAGSSLNGMAFSQFDGRATWDYAGKSSALASNPPPSGTNTPPAVTNPPPAVTNTPPAVTNTAPVVTNTTPVLTNTPPVTSTPTPVLTNATPGISIVDGATPEIPAAGANTLHVLTPTMLELVYINQKTSDSASLADWNLVDNDQFNAPPTSAFTVTANGQAVGIAAIGFKRRPIYAPLAGYDLRIGNYLYLQLSTPISDNQVIEVKNPTASLWPADKQFIAQADPLRFSPAIHVNQEGYLPNFAKKAMVGYYAGSFGELNLPASSGFKLVEANTGKQVFQGSLVQRVDVGFNSNPTPYQKVYEADFTAFNTPGEYRLVVPGMGGSLPFLIDSGIGMAFARTYALGLYHQRCGTATTLPYTRFTHDVCHAAQASVPTDQSAFAWTWNTIAGYGSAPNANNPAQSAPALTSPSAQLFPFVNQGPLDVSGGHHDAGDYSKYTINSASLVHYLMFAADSLAGVAALDNLGIPESGDGISDLLQEAKWEADYLAKMQDADGGFYFLVYPTSREYESDKTPDKGDAQVVWPKTTSVTAASVAALAQCASSPLFKKAYPQVAAAYLQKAKLGWQFLTRAIAKYGKSGAYQKITHYGDNFTDDDELAWAACQMFLATGDASIHQTLLSWFDPANPATWHWGWVHMCEGYGHAIRSYAFAVQSGRVASTSALDASFLAKCQTEIARAADAVLSASKKSAYGTSFPAETKAVNAAGWYFSCDQAFDLAVAYQLSPKAEYLDALLANLNYEGGCNPVNVSFITGLGWKRQRDVVSQWALNDTRTLPPSGFLVGNVIGSFSYLWNYQSALGSLVFPSDGASSNPHPFYDRWGDSWNVSAEMVVLNQARGLGALAFLAALTPAKAQAWKPVAGTIKVPATSVAVGTKVTVTLSAPNLDLSGARITWEARDQEPAYGASFTFVPKNNGTQWVEAEAQLPDGRRVFAQAAFEAGAANP